MYPNINFTDWETEDLSSLLSNLREQLDLIGYDYEGNLTSYGAWTKIQLENANGELQRRG